MVKSVQEFQARAAACRAAAASEALEKVRQVHLTAASKWEMLADQAQWIAGPSEQPLAVQPSAGSRSAIPLQVDGWPRNELIPIATNSIDTARDAKDSSLRNVLSLRDDASDSDSAAICDAPASENAKIMLFANDGHLRKLTEIEGDVIRLAIELYRGRISEVARRLGIGRSTLYRKMDEHGIDSPS